MTLPKRFVSLLLIYCFVLAIAPFKVSASLADVRVPASAGQSLDTKNSTEVGTLTPLGRAYNFLSSLLSSKQTNSADDEDVEKEAEGLKFRLSEAPEQPEPKAVSKAAEVSSAAAKGRNCHAAVSGRA